jgi:hypothetical protein
VNAPQPIKSTGQERNGQVSTLLGRLTDDELDEMLIKLGWHTPEGNPDYSRLDYPFKSRLNHPFNYHTRDKKNDSKDLPG